ncbi:T9SS type A sorting domain-containing protein [Chryseobacterium rhizosphaerae]|uniref:T9SS type A sorting domain-containing protein n=1 Tax=Chryseobacterium rhizosphaerae TaxID=395937 RepID=UPI00235888A6|nr:T9SS type A sorting domain-containing protein [Chryseobacterium rhizosphaerae]MDC8101776.1 T9SS type A sorting domain-containing protein [Chryseobacterium rhizosphaerae]
MKYLIIAFLFCLSFVKSQVGDNGYPFLYGKLSSERRITSREEYKNSSGNSIPLLQLKGNIKTFETDGINNQQIINEVANLKGEAYENQNIYGKSVYREINIANSNERIEYDGRYYNLYKIKSSDAKAIQIYFKKYHLPKGSTLYFYSENGFILGEFNEKNNPDSNTKELEFGTQPIPGNNFYIELSYPTSSIDKPELIAEKIIHSTTDFYGGAYGQAGNCHKNIACDFTGTNDKSRNMKSVGLMLYPLYINGVKQSSYSASCSGNLMNNTKQDGTPYFLTAAHCIGPAAANNNINWSTELITLFNYEAKTCTSNGSDAPSSLSNNSVLGCTVLTQSPEQAGDYALLMLKTTATKLTEYKVCFAGWDNNPNSYTVNINNTYGIHHPNGDTKKISFLKNIFPVSSNQGQFAQPDLQGKFLKTTWRDGIVEKGSSGSPLFNSFDKLIGSLSTGPDPNYFNCSASDKYEGVWFTYYSRFSYNYYTMSPWLNSLGSNVQSIGPYCPNTSIQIGASISVVFPGGGGTPTNPGTIEDVPIDVNGKPTHPSNTFGKNIYLQMNANTVYNNENAPNTNFYFDERSLHMSDNMFVASTNIYTAWNQNVVNNLELWGIYKIIDCNKLKYVKPAPIIIRNPVTMPGQLNEVKVDVVGITNERIHILIYSSKRDGNNNLYMNYELQTYKVVNNELVYVTYYPIISNALSSYGSYYSITEYKKNRLLLGRHQGGNHATLDSYFFNESTNTWSSSNNVLAFNSLNYYVKMFDDKVFVLTDAFSPTGVEFANKLTVYNFDTNSSNLSLQANLQNIFLGTIRADGFFYGIRDISKRGNNEYWLIYDKYTSGGPNFQLMSLNLSNNSVLHFSVSDDFKYAGSSGNSRFIIRDNEIVKIVKNTGSPPTGGEYPTHMYMSFTNPNGIWERTKINYVKWRNVAGVNNRYIVTVDMLRNGSIGNFSTKDWTLNIKELDYINHPYTLYDNVTYYTAAYHRPKRLENDLFDQGIENGKRVFKNIVLANTSNFPFKFDPGDGTSSYDTRTYEMRTVILDNKTTPITGNKNVYVYAKYSVDIKPGFSVSSSNGVEFHAIAQELLPTDVPACSFMFDDMLNPKLTETPNETLYLKQAVMKSGIEPHYGEIVLNDGLTNKEVVIDQGVRLYPNPTNDILNIDFNGNKFKTLEVYSIDAKKIITKEVSSMNFVEVNLSQYPAGIYMITLIDSNGKTYPNKVVKK